MPDEPTRFKARARRSHVVRDADPQERIALDPASPLWAEHESRYLFASGFARDKVVLDVACGTGMVFGTVAPIARRVIGADLSFDALLECRRQYDGAALVCRGDATALPFPDRSFDLVMSFETVEHVADDDRFIYELRRVLRPEGVLLLSTPNAVFTKPQGGVPSNPFHVREYLPHELLSLLGPHFSDIRLMRQRTSDAYGICPYWEASELISRDMITQTKVAIWKLENRLPWRTREWISKHIHRRSYYPTASDFTITDEGRDGHVLVALCAATSADLFSRGDQQC